MLLNNHYNPDVLTCLANLSNDEVFTPPQVVNQMLDMLPQELFRSSRTTFLDPVSKSGVFLREIAKRLMQGLEDEMPDIRQRANHIFTRQLFGISITELTSLISRRSVYCSKSANGRYSLCTEFKDVQGNIRFRPMEHTFINGKCKYCGAAENVFGKRVRGNLESHAYEFIHTDNPQKLFGKMKFDVIIGNPPYQLNDGGGRDSAAIPLYHNFIIQAKKLNPSFLSMIIPARWYTGGRGLDDFRNQMLSDERLSIIHDFQETNDCFPGLNIRGGICYFLWDSRHHGDCKIINHIKDEVNIMTRPLLELGCSVFIRHNQAVSILQKVRIQNEENFSNYVSSSKPFGMRSNFSDFKTTKSIENNIRLYRFGDIGYININQVERLENLIPRWKVIVSKASPGGDDYPHAIVSQPIVAEPNSACTETYLVIKDFDTKEQCDNLVSYIKTKFFRFMMSLMKNTQNIAKASYSFVPLQDFSHPWTDAMLYEKYSLTDDEITFIESMIRPME